MYSEPTSKLLLACYVRSEHASKQLLTCHEFSELLLENRYKHVVHAHNTLVR